MAPAIVPKTSTAAPSQADVSAISDTIYTSKASQESLDASYALVNLFLNSVGYRGLSSYGIAQDVQKAAADKKNGAKRESAMFVVGAAFEKFPVQQPISEVVFLLQHTELVFCAFDALADKGSSVREAAQYALDALFNNLKPESLTVGFLPLVEKYLNKKSGKWQGIVGALQTIGKMADKAKMGTGSREEEKVKDILRESMGKRLEKLIPTVEQYMHDLKPEVWPHSFNHPLRVRVLN